GYPQAAGPEVSVMKLYAERPGRRFAQLTTDAVAISWLVAGSRLAWWTFEQLLRLQAPGQQLAQTGAHISGVFADGAAAAGRTPLVGDELAKAMGSGTEAGAALARAGRTQAEAMATLATGAAILIVLVVLLPLLFWWLPARWRYARTAGAVAAVRASDTELLALRALVHLPPRRLLAVSDDPAASWRSRDPVVCRHLADLELTRLGLRGTTRLETA
ncbi:MAG TPA: hypothetical protein VHH34_20175, partial [Pseudonocardiaceae bacterium]|nr:hypothetical protein [Pseudonocardiaceae bacterium]